MALGIAIAAGLYIAGLDLLEAQMRRAALALGGLAAEEKPARYDQARAGQPAEAEMPAAGTGGQRGDDQ